LLFGERVEGSAVKYPEAKHFGAVQPLNQPSPNPVRYTGSAVEKHLRRGI